MPHSDCDPSHRPTGSQYRKFDPDDGYLEKLATLWMEEAARAVLSGSPSSRILRTNNPQHIDKCCYSHPNHKSFDSPNRFFPHFLHLMEMGQMIHVLAPHARCQKAIKQPLMGL